MVYSVTIFNVFKQVAPKTEFVKECVLQKNVFLITRILIDKVSLIKTIWSATINKSNSLPKELGPIWCEAIKSKMKASQNVFNKIAF